MTMLTIMMTMMTITMMTNMMTMVMTAGWKNARPPRTDGGQQQLSHPFDDYDDDHHHDE